VLAPNQRSGDNKVEVSQGFFCRASSLRAPFSKPDSSQNEMFFQSKEMKVRRKNTLSACVSLSLSFSFPCQLQLSPHPTHTHTHPPLYYSHTLILTLKVHLMGFSSLSYSVICFNSLPRLCSLLGEFYLQRRYISRSSIQGFQRQ